MMFRNAWLPFFYFNGFKLILLWMKIFIMITRPINVYITKTKQFKWKFKQQNEKNWSDFWLSMIRNELQNSKSTLIPNYKSKNLGLSLIL